MVKIYRIKAQIKFLWRLAYEGKIPACDVYTYHIIGNVI